MRTIPEIVAEMKELIQELEKHTGVPPKKDYDSPYTIAPSDTISFTFDNMNTGDYTFSHYENMSGVDVINLSPNTVKL